MPRQRVAQAWKLCAWCKKPVYSHADSHEEREGGAKRLWHRKKCWPREKKRRRDLLRQVEEHITPTGNPAVDEIMETAPLAVSRRDRRWLLGDEDAVPPPVVKVPEPPPVPSVQAPSSPIPLPEPSPLAALVAPPKRAPQNKANFRGQRGLGGKIHTLVRKQHGVFTKELILEELQAKGETTTLNTVGWAINTYAKEHPLLVMRRMTAPTLYLHRRDLVPFILSTSERPAPAPELPLPPPPPAELPPEVRARIDAILDALQALVVEARREIEQLLTPGISFRRVN